MEGKGGQRADGEEGNDEGASTQTATRNSWTPGFQKQRWETIIQPFIFPDQHTALFSKYGGTVSLGLSADQYLDTLSLSSFTELIISSFEVEEKCTVSKNKLLQ